FLYTAALPTPTYPLSLHERSSDLTITPGARFTISSAYGPTALGSPPAKRISSCRFWPSFHPSASSPSRSAAIDVWVNSSYTGSRSEEHTSELQSRSDLVCRLLLEK